MSQDARKIMGMTGFGRTGHETDWGNWTWEAKAVNGRGLDVRVNVPSGFEGLEQAVKKLASAKFARGNMQVSLKIEMAASNVVTVNQAALKSLAADFEAHAGQPPAGEALAVLMTAHGVLETGGGSGGNQRALGQDEGVRATLLESAGEALGQLEASRAAEGKALHVILSQGLDDMALCCKDAEAVAGEQPALLKARLTTKLEELTADMMVDADRLAAEAALAAAKADVKEELDRLAAHIETARGHLASGQPIGRKLDFLSQELNREANTLCAKSASLALTNAGLALKILIDQFKEQAANVE